MKMTTKATVMVAMMALMAVAVSGNASADHLPDTIPGPGDGEIGPCRYHFGADGNQAGVGQGGVQSGLDVDFNCYLFQLRPA